jgi:hypothetical protein
MFIYLTGNINEATDIELFIKIEKELRKLGDRVNNLIYLSLSSDKEYKINRMKSVLKADKVIFVKGFENNNDAIMEFELAKYIGIPTEIYNDTDIN